MSCEDVTRLALAVASFVAAGVFAVVPARLVGWGYLPVGLFIALWLSLGGIGMLDLATFIDWSPLGGDLVKVLNLSYAAALIAMAGMMTMMSFTYRRLRRESEWVVAALIEARRLLALTLA